MCLARHRNVVNSFSSPVFSSILPHHFYSSISSLCGMVGRRDVGMVEKRVVCPHTSLCALFYFFGKVDG